MKKKKISVSAIVISVATVVGMLLFLVGTCATLEMGERNSWTSAMMVIGIIILLMAFGSLIAAANDRGTTGKSICVRPEPTTNPPISRPVANCPHCGFPVPPPIRTIKEGEQKQGRIYPKHCPNCGTPFPDPPEFEKYKEMP